MNCYSATLIARLHFNIYSIVVYIRDQQIRNSNQLSVDYGWEILQSQWIRFDIPFHGLLGTLQKGKMRSKNLKVKIKNLDIIMPKFVKAYNVFYNS